MLLALNPEAKQAENKNGPQLIPIERSIVDFTNAERARYGLATLEVDAELMKSARRHTAWMTNNRSLVHTSRPVAENIAMGQPDSRAVVAAWMNSSGHRANILSSRNRRIGVAAYRIVRRLPAELKGKLPEPAQIEQLLEAVELPSETEPPSGGEGM